jgi:DNA-binding response OmpR family regulator
MGVIESGKTILVIDDEQNILNVVRLHLESEGYKVKTARSAREGLEAARQGGVDLVVLDIMMPGMDGYEACRQLAGDSRTFSIPVLFLTAKAQSSDRLIGFFAGAQDYITKPFKKKELLQRIKRLLKED